MSFVTTAHDGHVATVTLAAADTKNAIPDAGWDELRAAFVTLAALRDVRAVIVRGAGSAFCSGADLRDAAGDGGGGPARKLERLRRLRDAALALHQLPQPTIAAVDGVAAGAGFNLALGCDIVVASDRARFTQIFVRRGLSLDFGGAWLLPRILGPHKAKELAFLGDVISAEQAHELGLVNHVVPAADLPRSFDRSPIGWWRFPLSACP